MLSHCNLKRQQLEIIDPEKIGTVKIWSNFLSPPIDGLSVFFLWVHLLPSPIAMAEMKCTISKQGHKSTWLSWDAEWKPFTTYTVQLP